MSDQRAASWARCQVSLATKIQTAFKPLRLRRQRRVLLAGLKVRLAMFGPLNAPRIFEMPSAAQERHRKRQARRVQKEREGKGEFKPPTLKTRMGR